MRISGIEKRKRQARYDVYADGVYLATLSDEAILTHRLKVGMELPEGELVVIIEEAAKQDAVNCILTLLSGKAYTCKMARDKLREKGFGKEAVDYAVEKMLDYGYLDDLAYAAGTLAKGNCGFNRAIGVEGRLRSRGLHE